MEYPAHFAADKKGYVVTFPDVPEAITEGDTLEQARVMAAEALETALTFYTEEWRDLPVPSAPKRGQRMVPVPALSSMKLELYSAMRREGVRKADLARRLKVAPSQVDRLLDIAHQSKVDQIEAAFAAIGKKLAISVEAA